ncbi:hypothetical protein JSO19_03960 [Leucobacter sp. UCMA 4100]|uniref:hypothetical protein n=1 Tax=Leucobacter sp. UCMA 4100 TaxID=2810534 RepID=UPI0022EA3B75|nr:hypothetical protein [Leucobacter sp. UCMA 4100]MDA3146531.1 hypothetical protein [Leucobacter sp. UCMA 4100]
MIAPLNLPVVTVLAVVGLISGIAGVLITASALERSIQNQRPNSERKPVTLYYLTGVFLAVAGYLGMAGINPVGEALL